MRTRSFLLTRYFGRQLCTGIAALSLSQLVFAGVTVQALDQLAGYGQSRPFAINNAGQIAGLQFDVDLPFSAVVWRGTQIVANITAGLDPLPGLNNFAPNDINNSGMISGRYVQRDTTQCPSFLCSSAAYWDGTGVTQLAGSRTSAFPEPSALSINDSGQMAGFARSGGSPYRAVTGTITVPRDGTIKRPLCFKFRSQPN